VRLDIGPVDLGTLLQTTMQGLQPAADAKGIQLIASVGSVIGPIVGDSRRLQQVLWNLVHNGIKFTSGGGRVEIHVKRAEGHLQIVVQDNGQGISPAFLPHVFERFRQEDSSSTRAAFGLGLGLSIAKQIVELHGGSIQARSAGEGQGSTFTVHVPSAPGATLPPDRKEVAGHRDAHEGAPSLGGRLPSNR
jgi:signal transduction histidine kinase